MVQGSKYINAHKKKVADAYCSILKFSIAPGNNIYDGAILSKCITCIEHMFKATYILKFKDEVNFDVNHVQQSAILERINKKLNPRYKIQSLNLALGMLLQSKGILNTEFFNIYSSINPERNNETHRTAEVSQESIVKGLSKIKSMCNWFFAQLEDYDWEEQFIDNSLRAYETTFMLTLSNYLKSYSLRNIKNLEIISKNYFDQEVVSSEEKRKLTLDYYLKFNNSWNYIKRVVANNIHITFQDSFSIKNQEEDEESENVRIHDVVKLSSKGQPILLKIGAVGGVGKTTLLWQLIKHFHKSSHCFYIQRVDSNAIDYIFENVITEKSNTPVLLFLDDPVSTEDNKKNIVAFGEAIAEKSPIAPIVLFIAERLYRYERFKDKKDFERSFSGGILNLPYSSYSIRNDVFEKIYESLAIANENSSEKFKFDCRNIFNQYNFESLIDSTYHLIKYLQKSTSAININYKFDWEDWEVACNSHFEKYGVLEDLFKLVAFFYRFGITIPFEYLKDYYGNITRINDLTRQLIGNFGDDYSPIILEDDEESEKRILRLRHEKMGEWYFQNISDSKDVEKELFLQLMENINSRSACYLFRNLHRNAEFLSSHLHQYLSNKKRIDIIDKYLATIDEAKYCDEEYKILMEKHFTLINMGRGEDSIKPLQQILKLNNENIFAATRMATCIENGDPENAENLYLKVQKLSPKNRIATLNLYRLYYLNPQLNKFENYQDEIFHIATSNSSFSFYLISFIETNFNKLSRSTVDHLLNLHLSHILLRLKIAELLIDKNRITEAYQILVLQSKSTENSDCKTRTNIARLLIKLYEKQTNENIEALNLVQNLIGRNHLLEPTDPYSTYLYAKTQSLLGNSKKAEKYFARAYELDKHNINLFSSIGKFYRTTSKEFRDKEDHIRTIIYLLKGIAFIQQQLKSGFMMYSNQYKLELALFLNELTRAYQTYSKYLPNPTNKYSQKVADTESECEKHLLSCIKDIKIKFIKPDGELFYSHHTDSLMGQYSKGCSLLAKMYSNHAYRVKYRQNQSSLQSELEFREYLLKGKDILQKAIQVDNDNPTSIIDLLEIDLALNDNSYVPNLEEINFQNFNLKHKVKLCKCLIKFNHVTTAQGLLRKFGPLNSTGLFLKNDLVYCYIETGEWGQAIRILSNIGNPESKTLELMYRVALEMPIVNAEKARFKIEFSEMCLLKAKRAKYPLHINICETLFKSCNIDESWYYFLNNIYRDDKSLPELGFYQLYKDWIPGLVSYCTKLNAMSETAIFKTKKYKDGIGIISSMLTNLFKIKYSFSDIHYILINNDPLHEKIKAIVGRSISALLFVITSNETYSMKAKNILHKISITTPNPLFHKILLRKIIDPNKPCPLIKEEWFVQNFENIYINDRDILGMLGQFYLENEKFTKSYELLIRAHNEDRNTNEQCYSLCNLARWIIVKIEKEGLASFGNIEKIREKIDEAEQKINMGLEFLPDFKYAPGLMERICSLRTKYLTLN